MPNVKIGVRTSLLGSSLRRCLQTAASSGAAGVEIDLRDEVPIDQLSATAQRQLRKWLDDTQLTLAAGRFSTRRSLAHPERLERRLAAIEQALSATYALGGRVLVQSGGLPHVDEHTVQDEVLLEVLDRLSAYGNRVGCHLVFEIEAFEIEAVQMLAERIAGDSLHLACHTGHLLAAGVNIAESVMPLGRLWRHLYVVDGFRDFASRRFVATQLGRGSLDVDELAAVMDGIGYDGWWMVEPTDGAATAESLSLAANFLRNL